MVLHDCQDDERIGRAVMLHNINVRVHTPYLPAATACIGIAKRLVGRMHVVSRRQQLSKAKAHWNATEKLSLCRRLA
jgi:hypothetical protein